MMPANGRWDLIRRVKVNPRRRYTTERKCPESCCAVHSVTDITTEQFPPYSPSECTTNLYHLREVACLLLLSKAFCLTLVISCVVRVERGAPAWGLVYWSLCNERFARRANFCNRVAHVWHCDQLDVLCWTSDRTAASTQPWIAPVQIGRSSRKPFQTDPGVHPAYCTMGTLSLSRW